MVKVKILDKGINTVKLGFLSAGSSVEVPGHFADWLVKSGRAQKDESKPVKKAAKK